MAVITSAMYPTSQKVDLGIKALQAAERGELPGDRGFRFTSVFRQTVDGCLGVPQEMLRQGDEEMIDDIAAMPRTAAVAAVFGAHRCTIRTYVDKLSAR